jgi:hypothetical protein
MEIFEFLWFLSRFFSKTQYRFSIEEEGILGPCMDLVLTYSTDKLVKYFETDFKMILKFTVFDLFYEKLHFSLQNLRKVCWKLKLRLKPNLKLNGNTFLSIIFKKTKSSCDDISEIHLKFEIISCLVDSR